MPLPTHGPFPSVGLYWFINADPTVGLGLPAPLGQLAVRTDNDTFYVKSGSADTAWAALTGSAGGTIASDGTTIKGNGSIANPIEIKKVQHDLSMSGNGTVSAPLSVVFPPVVTRQAFRVQQQPGDTDTIIINLARGLLLRASTNYGVHATMGTNSLGVGIVGCNPAEYLTTQFVFRLTSAWANGDSVFFTVEDLT